MLEEQHRAYFGEHVEPFLKPGEVEYVGPLSRNELGALYRRAAGVLLLSNWHEPFGLVEDAVAIP